MNDGAMSYFAAIQARRLRAEWWAHEEETFDLVLAAALMRLR